VYTEREVDTAIEEIREINNELLQRFLMDRAGNRGEDGGQTVQNGELGEPVQGPDGAEGVIPGGAPPPII
jgi:hypothetical protein